MSFKEKLKNLVPSYRMGNIIIKHFDEEIEEIRFKNDYLFWVSQNLINESPLDTKKECLKKCPLRRVNPESVNLPVITYFNV